MISISGKNFSFQSSNLKNSISIKISTAGSVQFNNVASQVKDQLADKPELPKGKPTQDALPPRAIEPIPNLPVVAPVGGVILGDALDPPNGEFQIGGSPSNGAKPDVGGSAPQGIVLGDALDPPNGEFQIAGSPSTLEPPTNMLRDIVRVPSLDNIQFVETDLSRQLKAEAAGGFDQELIASTGLQPEVAETAPLEEPQGIILGDALDPPNGEFQILGSPSNGTKPDVGGSAPQGIILGDALDPPNGEFQIGGSPSGLEPTRDIPRDIVIVPSLDNIQRVETDLSRQLAADQKLDSKANDEVKPNLFNFRITNP